MRMPVRWRWFAGFTAAFAVLAAYVFWGTWSPDAAPVMPDDCVSHVLSFPKQFSGWFDAWLRNGLFVPVDVFWNSAFVSKYWTQEFKYVSGMFFSALGLAYFLRARGLSYLASYGAGLLLGFCGYWSTLFSAGHGTWFILVSSMVPAFAFLDRAIVGGRFRDWILLGACVGWGCCYQQDLFLLFAVLLTCYGIYACCRARKFPWQGALIALAVFGVVGAAGIRSAFKDALGGRDRQIAESAGTALAGGKGTTAEDASDAEKKKAADEARWVFVTNWSMPPEDTLEFFVPRIHGDTSCPMTQQLGRAAGKDVKPYTGRLGRPLNAPQGNYRQHSLYVGWVTCLLALAGLIVGVVRGRSRGDVVFFAAAAFVCWLCSMGRFCEPVYRIIYALPFGDYLRAPVKWHHLTEFCLCILAGFGLEALLSGLKAKGLATRTVLAIVAGVALVGAADLARIDRLFCAPIDLRLVRGRNAAADEIVRRGKGTLCDLVEGGRGFVAWSFNAHDVGTTHDPMAKDTRFVWVLADQVKRTPQLAAWLQAKAQPVGSYAVTRTEIRAMSPDRANATLYQVNGVPPPPEPTHPPVQPLVLTLALVSLLSTGVILGYCWSNFIRMFKHEFSR